MKNKQHLEKMKIERDKGRSDCSDLSDFDPSFVLSFITAQAVSS